MSGASPDSKADSQPKPSRSITYRLRLIPEFFDRKTLRQALCDLFTLNDEDVTVHTLAWDAPYGRNTREKIGTVTFRNKPAKLSIGNTWELKIYSQANGTREEHDVCLDNTFEDFTPITQAEDEEATNVDCIFIHGLGGHAIGSFSSPNGNWFWPRDNLCKDFPRLRVWLYGYHSAIKDADSITSVYDYANTFRKALRSARNSMSMTSSRPLLFIVHSLGGWILQHAMIGMAESEDSDDKTNLQATCGALLCGVPNQGMHVDQTMMGVLQAKKLPAYYTVTLLDQQLGFALREQHENQFHRACTKTNVKLYVFYEEEKTATYRQDEATGNWIQDGPPALSVNPASATYGHYQYENKISLKKNHNNMLKFTRGDLQYKRLLQPLDSILKNVTLDQGNKPEHLTKDEQECLQSLAFAEMTSREINISKPTEGTCVWLAEHPQYVKWSTARNGILWIKGHPGVGKSTVMRHVLRMSHDSPNSTIILSFFFHGTGTDLQKNLLGLYRSLMHQLASHSSKVMSDLRRVFASRTRSLGRIDEKWKWEEKELQDWILKYLLDLGGRRAIRIYVDALDEVDEDQAARFLDFLEEVGRLCDESKRLAICFASRHYPSFSFESTYEITVERENTSDIKAYIQNSLGLEKLKQALSEPDTIVEAILARAGNSFQWSTVVVKRTLDMVKRGRGTAALLKMIRDTPQQLAALYRHLIRQIDQEDRAQSLRMFQWLVFGARSYTMDDLRIALTLEDRETTLETCLDSEYYCESNLAMENRLCILSAGLVECQTNYTERWVFSKSSRYSFSEPRKTANLIHQSVLDFLLDGGLELLGCERYPSIGAVSKVLLARLCLFRIGAHPDTLITWESLYTVPPNHEPKPDQFAEEFMYQYGTTVKRFYEHSVKVDVASHSELSNEGVYQEWILEISWEFYRKIQLPFLERCLYDIPDLLKALDDVMDLEYIRNGLLPFIQSDLPVFHRFGSYKYLVCTAPILDLGAIWGVKSLIMVGLDADLDVNARNEDDGRTALHVAVQHGRTDIVEMLMKTPGIDLSLPDHERSTPLAIALKWDKQDVAMMLLDHADVKIDIEVRVLLDTHPLLHYIIDKGKYTLLEKLLERPDLDVNIQDGAGLTPIMRMLGNHGRNPVLVERLITLFLKRSDVQLNIQVNARINGEDLSGITALMVAAWQSNFAIVKLLIQAGADPSLSDARGYTAFDYVFDCVQDVITENADLNEELLIAGILLTNQIDRDGTRFHGTPYLHCAVRLGWMAGVELLLTSGSNVNIQDLDGRTSLHWAAYYGRSKMLKMLLEHNVDPDRQDWEGDTPLHTASQYGHYVVARILVNFGSNIDVQSCNGCTALHLASHPLMADLLIRKGASLNIRDANGCTPLHLAVIKHDASMVALLLNQGANVNIQDKSGSSCLHYALFCGCDSIVRLLLGRSVNVELKGTHGWTALAFLTYHFKTSSICQTRDHFGSIQSRTRTTDLDSDEGSLSTTDTDLDEGRLSRPVPKRARSMPNLQLCRKEDSSEYCNHSGPFICSRGKGIRLRSLLDLLLDHGVNLNTVNREGRTPLRIAREFKHTTIEQWLMEHGARDSLEK